MLLELTVTTSVIYLLNDCCYWFLFTWPSYFVAGRVVKYCVFICLSVDLHISSLAVAQPRLMTVGDFIFPLKPSFKLKF